MSETYGKRNARLARESFYRNHPNDKDHMEPLSHEFLEYVHRIEKSHARTVDALACCEYEIMACLRDESVRNNADVLSALQTAYDEASRALKAAREIK